MAWWRKHMFWYAGKKIVEKTNGDSKNFYISTKKSKNIYNSFHTNINQIFKCDKKMFLSTKLAC